MRHLAIGSGAIKDLAELRGPMAAVIDHFTSQRDELERYRKTFGPLPHPSVDDDDGDTLNTVETIDNADTLHSVETIETDDTEHSEDDGSDTEQE